MKNSTIVLVLLIIVAGVGAYYFLSQESGPAQSGAVPPPVGTDLSGWQTYNGTTASLKYSPDFVVNDISASGPTEWRVNAGEQPGTLDFSITLPGSVQPQTNFIDAKLTLGESADVRAVADCLTPDQSGSAGTLTTKVLNGVTFTVFTFSDAGAGNLYDSTSYRAVHNGSCIALEYTIHSTQIANYPPDSGITQFSVSQVKEMLDQVASTLTLN